MDTEEHHESVRQNDKKKVEQHVKIKNILNQPKEKETKLAEYGTDLSEFRIAMDRFRKPANSTSLG
jgi:hypothetical protein